MLSIDFLPNIGGITAHVYELSKALVKEGNEVFVFTYKRKIGDRSYEEIDGIKVYRTYLPTLFFPVRRIAKTFVYAFPVWLKILRLINNKHIDVIHYHNIFPDAYIAKFIGKVPRVQTEHSSGFRRAIETGKNKRLYKWLLSGADHIIVPSQEMVHAVAKLGVNPAKVSFIPNGVDTDRFNPRVSGDKLREDFKVRPQEKLILYPGRLEPVKGIEYLITALPKIVQQGIDIKCLVVGDGSESARLKQQVIDFGLASRVIFAGRVPNAEMPEYYAAADVVVLPSLTEGMPVAGLEAMATGKPLVGTRVGGIPQIIDDAETGILVPAKDPEQLAYAIASLLSDDEKRTRMGSSARKKAESEFSWEIIARRTKNVYDMVLSRP